MVLDNTDFSFEGRRAPSGDVGIPDIRMFCDEFEGDLLTGSPDKDRGPLVLNRGWSTWSSV